MRPAGPLRFCGDVWTMPQPRAHTPPAAVPLARRSSSSRLSAETARVLPVLLPVALGGAAVTIAAAWSYAASEPDWRELVGVLALLAATTAAEAVPVPIEGVAAGRGRTSLATVFIVATAALFGWAPAALVGACAMAIVEIATRTAFTRVVFNANLYALSGAAAGIAFAAVDGESLAGLALGTAFAAATFYVVNIVLLAAVVARASGDRSDALLRTYVTQTAVPLAVMGSVSIVLVVVWESSPWASLALVAPLAAFVLYERRMHSALERLRELDRLKDEFIAVVSHELRTPLASVYGAAMTLQRHELDPTTRDAMLAIVYRESARLARLVDQVLWASRLEAGREDVSLASLDGVRLANDVVAAARAHVPDELTLDVVSAPQTPPVSGDVDKVKQVLVNLVENAVKYSPAGGRVEVRIEPSGSAVRFSVADEGLGIPKAEQHRIFEKFHRLDPTMTRGVGGTGLGLYVSRELVMRMDGRIWVVSSPGEGSTFVVELPRADPS
jgi:signal transduction histidine kinase